MVYSMVCTQYFERCASIFCALYGDVQDLGELRSWGHLSVSVSLLCMLCASLTLCTFGSVHMHLCVQELQEHSENGHVSLRDEAISGMCAHTRTHARTHTRKHTPIHTRAVCKTQVGTPGVAWGADERSAWKALQVNKRSYADEVLRYTQEQEMCVRVCVCVCAYASVCMCL